MDLYVACDVCGHRYVLPGDRGGRNAKCKSCGVSFEVDSANFYDPDTSEMDDEEDDDEKDSSLTPVWDIAKKVGHAMAGLVTLMMLVWMSTLLFRSPRDAVAQNGRSTARSPSNQQTPQFNPSAPRVAPFQPRPIETRPQPFPGPQVTPVPRVPNGLQPPGIDGSIGWPKDEPEQPARPAPRSRVFKQ